MRLYLIALCIFCSTSVLADNPHEQLKRNQVELKKLQQQIKSAMTGLHKINSKLDRLHGELEKIEVGISQLQGKIQRNVLNIEKLEKDLAVLDKQRRQQQSALRKQQHLLNKQLKASLILGQQKGLKFVLNQQDPNSLGRNLYLFQRLNDRRARQVQSLRQDLQQLDKTEVQINEQSSRLKRITAQQNQNKRKLQVSLIERKKLLQRLDQERNRQQQTLSLLKSDEKRLLDLIKEIKTHIPPIDIAQPSLAFSKRKGKLLWPVVQKRHQAMKKLQGLMIPAAAGSPVRAVAPGQVIFAEWLRAYGLLMIINHGEGYLSLYGFNQQIHKKLGDWVQAGDVIALSGNTGGQKESGLYFELRKDTEVLSVLPWMAKKFSMIND